MPLKWYCWPGAYCASQSPLEGCTSPVSSVARLISVDGCPSHCHGSRNRVRAFESTGSVRAAIVQVLPPLVDTSTFAIRLAPDHASPEISYNPGAFRFMPNDGLRIADLAACGKRNWRAFPPGINSV